MSTSSLGRLVKVPLRDEWVSEPGDFTPWLAQEQNLKLLSDIIGIELELEEQEKAVGPFRADILCKDTTNDDHWVLIENQLERTDHTHLGQLLTYAAGLKAATIVWIAERFTDEHRAALDWLNEITGEKFAFFGLEIELWKIGDSQKAPKFNIISKPNDWTKKIQDAAGKASGEVTDYKQKQLQFWLKFKEYMDENSYVKCQQPLRQSYMNHAIGRGGFHLTSALSSWNFETNAREPEVRVALVINDKNNSKTYFAMLEAQKEEIERNFGRSLIWYNPVNANVCSILIRRSGDFLNPDAWPELHEWLRSNLEKFHKLFATRVKQLTASTYSIDPDDNSPDVN